jgi:hypothetical protein
LVLSDCGSTAPLTIAVKPSAKLTSSFVADGTAAATPAGNAAQRSNSAIVA